MGNLLKKIKQLQKKFYIIHLTSGAIFIYLFLYISLFFITPNIYQIPYSSIVYDSNNIQIGEVIIDNKYRHQKVEFNEIPEFTKKVIIDLEDKTFYKNSGIDYIALIRASINNLKAGSIVEGASTISSQVIRNNYWLNEDRTLIKKLEEFYLSLALNKNYSKEDILSNYLSNIYFGYLNYGLKSASNYFFNKDLHNLTKAEQIALLSLPKNPRKYNPYTNRQEFKSRFKQVCDTLLNDKTITNLEYNEIISEKLVFNEDHENKLPYVVDYLKSYVIQSKENYNINSKTEKNLNTTIDYNLTTKINEIAKNSILPLMWKNVKDFGIVVIDRNAKELKVIIGGINYYGDNGQVSMVTSPRQVGSTLKPFTYLLSFKNLGYTPQTTILDLPTQFQTDLGYAYDPKNYSLDYKGEVSIAEALSQSINIPALKVTEKIGVQNLLDFLKELGITSLNKSADYYGLALTLGVGEINLLELTKAYSLFAYNGELCDIELIKLDPKIESMLPCKQIIDKKYIDMTNEILTNRYYKLEAFPINGNLDFPDKKVFLKTGTSRNFKDNWTIGYTDNYIIGVWAGNKDGSEMKGVSGASGAGEIFKAIVDYIEKNNYKSPINKIEKDTISYLEITSPLNNSKYKLDSTKPKSIQKIKLEFSTNLAYDSFKWYVNDEEINDTFLSLDKGNKEVKIVLFDKDGNIVKEEKNEIYIN